MKASIFAAITANANSGVITSTGKKATLVCSGGFGAGTITVKVQVDASNYVTTAQTLTAAGYLVIDLPQGTPYRIELTGATASTLTADLYYTP